MRQAEVTARVSWESALAALRKMVDNGTAADFCVNDVTKLLVIADSINELLRSAQRPH